MVGYTIQVDPDTTSKAIGKDLSISPKASIEICRVLRGKRVEDALTLLERVMDETKPIPYRRFNGHVGHRKGQGFGPGRYPVKASREITRVLESAVQNAEYKGLDPDNLKVLHIAAHRGREIDGWRPRAHGRSTPFQHEMVNVEIILQEVDQE